MLIERCPNDQEILYREMFQYLWVRFVVSRLGDRVCDGKWWNSNMSCDRYHDPSIRFLPLYWNFSCESSLNWYIVWHKTGIVLYQYLSLSLDNTKPGTADNNWGITVIITCQKVPQLATGLIWRLNHMGYDLSFLRQCLWRTTLGIRLLFSPCQSLHGSSR